ncbi:UNVERIFIED_CONTAM: hypothetical protein FKN15_014219 [Acipenser sinensis]
MAAADPRETTSAADPWEVMALGDPREVMAVGDLWEVTEAADTWEATAVGDPREATAVGDPQEAALEREPLAKKAAMGAPLLPLVVEVEAAGTPPTAGEVGAADSPPMEEVAACSTELSMLLAFYLLQDYKPLDYIICKPSSRVHW